MSTLKNDSKILSVMDNVLKKQIKRLLVEEDLKISELIPLLTEKTGHKYSYDSFIHRLQRATVTYVEMVNIADVLGYDIKFIKKNNQ